FNVSEALIRGGELTLGKSFGEWNTRLAMSYVDPRNLETDDVLSDRSRGTVDVSVDRRWGDFSWAKQWHAQSERINYDGLAGQDRKLGGFNTVAMKASYQISESLSMALKVNNLFDKEYQTRHQFRTDGRNATLSLRYGF
ncbi:MAG: TonB-dependent receptor, partial [Pseudomonadota bacterium]|nr:TonB-dependent receptor [Pseudomonadota bacterium]